MQTGKYANMQNLNSSSFYLFAHLLNCTFAYLFCGSSSFGRAVAFQASGGRFEPGLPLKKVLKKAQA
jgi:hypothetical protein